MQYMTFKNTLPKTQSYHQDWLNTAVNNLLDLLNMYHGMDLTLEEVIKRAMNESMAGIKAWDVALKKFI